MKKSILTFIILSFFYSSYAQCECEKIKRNDGTTITQCTPKLVAGDSFAELGLSLTSNNIDNYISLSIRYLSKSQDIGGNLSIRLANNELLTFSYVNSQMQYIGGSKMCNAIFLLSSDDTDLQKIKSSKIKNIYIMMEDGILYTYSAKVNYDVLIKQAPHLPLKSNRISIE